MYKYIFKNDQFGYALFIFLDVYDHSLSIKKTKIEFCGNKRAFSKNRKQAISSCNRL